MRDSLEKYFDRLWPICRSISGDGLRESFKIIQEIIPLSLIEVETGTQVHDWVVPKEWNIREAYIITPLGERIADFKVNNLHVVNYSVPVREQMSWEQLKPHLHTLKEKPDAVPYLTSYYKETWGFCLTYNQFKNLPQEGEYTVVIDSTLSHGSITLGHCILPGESSDEIIFSSYLCHPSMANNELSGPLALAFLYHELSKLPKRRFTYRFILAPETIGVIAYLSLFGDELKSKTKAGYVLTCVGDAGEYNFKRSKNPSSLVNRVAEHVLKYQEEKFSVREFSVGGSDERQYCSPGYNLPVGSLMRSVYHEFTQYHTSLDNKDFISFDHLERTILMYVKIAETFELMGTFRGTVLFGEPMLGKHGMYPSSSTPDVNRIEVMKLMHFLTYADGETNLIDIAEKTNHSVLEFRDIVNRCLEKGLVTRVE
jgi:aminopeptidase-like protein